MKIVSKLAFTVIVAALFIGSAATEALCLESGKAFPPFGTLFFSFSPSKVDDKSQGIGGEMQINIKKADFPFTFLSFPRSSFTYCSGPLACPGLHSNGDHGIDVNPHFYAVYSI